MFVVIRNGIELSPKAKFVARLLSENFNNEAFCIYKNEKEQFREKWGRNQIRLPSSVTGLIAFYLLLNIRSPKDYRSGLIARLSRKKRKHLLSGQGFLSVLTRALYLQFGTSFRQGRLMDLLKGLGKPNIFLIDEFISLNCVDLKRLLPHGSLIYVSQDIAYNRFSYGDNPVTRQLMLKLERDALSCFDLVVACSEMEKLKYLEFGAKKAISYPNIYPTAGFAPSEKDEMPSVSIVLREHWGPRARQSLETILNALSHLRQKVKVYMIGVEPDRVPKNVVLEYDEFLQRKLDYLMILSRSWIGINVGIHKAGTNERKYDYAEAGTVVLSDTLGARGDFLPYEYTYVDSHDLAAKMKQLFELGKVMLTRMGEENRIFALSTAETARLRLLDSLAKIAT